jgi:hypothetical protein
MSDIFEALDRIETRKCEACPRIAEDVACLQVIKGLREALIEDAFDPDLEKRAAEFLETVHDSGLLSFLDEVEGLTAGSNPRELAKQLRQHSAKIIELFDDHIAMHCVAIDMETANCPGPLRMRATAHKRIVTLTVCNSPVVLDGLTEDEPVRIQRDRVM